MSRTAKFYILSDANKTIETLACELVSSIWRSGKRVLIFCETEVQALNIDEMLWQQNPDEFVPHNLSGESTAFPAPIEISWAGKRNAQRRDVLINLQSQLPDFINSFNQFIDFVPVDETQKAQARERFKVLRANGWELSTENV